VGEKGWKGLDRKKEEEREVSFHFELSFFLSSFL